MKITINDDGYTENVYTADVCSGHPAVEDTINAFIALLKACGYSKDIINSGIKHIAVSTNTESECWCDPDLEGVNPSCPTHGEKVSTNAESEE